MPDVVGLALSSSLVQFGAGPAGLVFTNTLGRPLRRSTIGEMWHRARTRAGLPETTTFHDYADLRVMPTLGRSPWSTEVKDLELSA
jgi:hypothetical protein